MKLTFFVIICVIFSTCVNQPPSVPNNGGLNAYSGKLSLDTADDKFYHQVLREAILTLGEDRLTDSTQSNRQDIRLIIVPSTGGRSFFRIISDTSDSTLTMQYKRLNGFVPDRNVVDIELHRLIRKEDSAFAFDSLNYKLNKLDFWSMNADWTCNGGDGTIYFLEVVSGHKKNIICRWSPEACDYKNALELTMLIDYFERLKFINWKDTDR